MSRRIGAASAVLLGCLAITSAASRAEQPPRAADVPRSAHDIEVTATGCLSGDTLTETNLNRNPSNGVPNPARRWRLRVTSAQRQLLKELDPGRQVEVWGVADGRELESATVGKSVRVGPGRAYVGAESKKTPARAVVLPTLVVETVKQTADSCR